MLSSSVAARGLAVTAKFLFSHIGVCSKSSSVCSWETICTSQRGKKKYKKINKPVKYKGSAKSCLLFGSCWLSHLFNNRWSFQRPRYFLRAT